MNVRVKLLADDVWAAEEDKTGFLSVVVDIYDWLYLKEQPIYFPMATMSSINEYMIKEVMWEKSIKSKYVIILMNDQNIMLDYPPPMEKIKHSSKLIDWNFSIVWVFP